MKIILRTFPVRLLAALAAVITWSASLAQPRVALVTDHLATAEQKALQQVLQQAGAATIVPVSLTTLLKTGLHPYKAIWYHRTDTVAPDATEKAATAAIRQWVQAGGNLLLAMEAMPLLNTWRWEPTPVGLRLDTVQDEGFGRPLGFHAFKTHPLFDGLQGGVYTSKQPVDHVVRKHGFFKDAVPQRCKVAGIDWTYITFSEENRLLVETEAGKGRVIAAGAYLYYAAPNANRQHLATFIHNVLARLLGTTSATKERYWQHNQLRYEQITFRQAPLPLQPASPWQLPAPSLQLTATNPGNEFYDLAGRRILWMGRLQYGMEEMWLHPFMALRDLEAGLQLPGVDSVTWLRHLQPAVQVTPEYLVRTYCFPGFTLREIYTVSFDQPYAVAHYEIDGNQPLQIVLKYATNLRYMWPYSEKATGSMQYAFHGPVNGHLFAAQQGELNTAVVYSTRPISQQMRALPGQQQVQTSCRLSLSKAAPVNVYMSGSEVSMEAALQTLRKAGASVNRLFEQSNRYYRDLLANHLQFDTPDTLFNEGYRWAMARTDQFVQTTPGLGTALMAGFGTTARGWNGRHPISGRPGYAWYFGRDAEWSAMAINAYGGFAAVKAQLETLIRYQDLNGKIYHELTSSGVAHYDASDATPLFIVLAAHYLRYSGDTAFIRRRWPAIQRALQYCYSTDTDQDGLIENTNVGHGWIEGGPLFGTHTEFYLAGCWAATLDAMDYMSRALKLPERNYRQQALGVKRQIDQEFWNGSKGYFYNGKMKDGSYMDQSTGFATVPMYLKAVTDSAKAFTVIQRITGSGFTTDWGIRMLEENNPGYKPGSYHAGMVWPLYGGWGSLAAYSNGLYKAGYQYLMSNLLVYRNWAPGSIEETLNGELYKPNGVCSHQCWSETMVLQPAIEGMLGLEADAVYRRIRLAPAFPWDWQFARITNIPAGPHKIQLAMQRDNGATTYTITTAAPVQLAFAPAFPQHTSIKSVTLNGYPLPYRIHQEADGIRVLIDMACQAGRQQLVVETAGGIGVLPIVTQATPGARSSGLKILSESMQDGHLACTAEGRPGASYTFKVWTAQPIKGVTNGRVLAVSGNTTTIALTLPVGGQPYTRTTLLLSFY